MTPSVHEGGGSDRSGVTIAEMLTALLIFGVIMAGALGFLNVQNKGLQTGMDRMSALQTLRNLLHSLENDLSTAGTNLVPGQPEIVVAGADVLAFNADYASNVENDLFAAFHLPDASAGQVTALRTSITIPETTFRYPSTTYTTPGGIPSSAELLIFFFAEDTATPRADDFVLYRQVNAADPEVVARNLLRTEGEPFFRYLRYRHQGSVLDSIPESRLPLYHRAEIHLSPADTGGPALIDSIRAVRVSVTATNGNEGDLEHTAQVTRLIRMPNLDLKILGRCGNPPTLGVLLSAHVVDLGPGEPAVELTWGPAVDESAGERDVIRYVIYRRAPTDDWGNPYLSIPAGRASYSYRDADVRSEDVWVYGLAAQDCTPRLSGIAATSAVPITSPEPLTPLPPTSPSGSSVSSVAPPDRTPAATRDSSTIA